MTNDAVSGAAKRTTNRSSSARAPLQIVNQDELLWWPYRSLSRALLQTHRNTVAFVQINRTLLDELGDISRRQQDFVLDVSEKVLATATHKRDAQNANPQAEKINEVYQVAVAGMREFGQAVADAHVRSVEALWRHAVKANAVESKTPPAQAAE